MFLYTDHQTLEPLIKRNRCNKQNSARITRWLDRLAHFDISIQHIAGSNLKFTVFLSRKPVGDATTKNMYNEQYVINILTEQAELNLKYGSVFTNHYSAHRTQKLRTTVNRTTNQKRIEDSRRTDT